MVHTRSIREIDKIAHSCQIVADTLIFLESVSYTHLTLPTICSV